MPSVAVIIVTWNASTLLERVLDSLEKQTCQPARIVIVDNGSADVAHLPSIIARHENCELIPLPENRGFAAANNVGIVRCPEADLIALLNPDAFPEPEWLAELVKAAERHPEAASFASRLLNDGDDTRLDGAGDYLTVAGKPGRRGHMQPAEDRYLDYEPVFAPCAAAALYRRKALMECGGFDERFFCYVEDVDLAFRMLLAGHLTHYVPTAAVRHVGSAITGRRSEFSVYHGQRNLIFNYVKNMPWPLFWAFLPLHLMLNLLYLAAAFAAGRGRVTWRSKRDALRQLPIMWCERRKIQAMRRVSSVKVARMLKFSLW